MAIRVTCRKTESKVLRPHSFVEMRAALNPAESDALDIILFLENRGESKDGLTFNIDITEFMDFFNSRTGKEVDTKYAGRRLQRGINGLYKLDIQFTEDTDVIKKNVSFRVIGAQASSSERGKVGVQLTPTFKEIIRHLKNLPGYAIYSLRYQLAFESEYSKRLYPMFIRWVGTGRRYDEADELREKLGVPSSYSQFKFLALLDEAIEEINKKSDIVITKKIKKSHSVKGGTKVDTFEFSVKANENALEEKKRDCMTHALALLRPSINNGELNEKDIDNMCATAEYDMQVIADAYECMISCKSKVENKRAYLIKAIKGKWKPEKNTSSQQCKYSLFNNFSQRKYTDEEMDDIELRLLKRSEKTHRKEEQSNAQI